MEPIRFITRHKSRNVKFYESECTDIDPESKTISITGNVIFCSLQSQKHGGKQYILVGTDQKIGVLTSEAQLFALALR